MVSWAWAGAAARPKASAAAAMRPRRVIGRWAAASGEVSIAIIPCLTHATSVRVAPAQTSQRACHGVGARKPLIPRQAWAGGNALHRVCATGAAAPAGELLIIWAGGWE